MIINLINDARNANQSSNHKGVKYIPVQAALSCQ